MSYTLIERRELTSDSSSILFENIPQIYTDLVILASLRNSSGSNQNGTLTLNGSTTGYSERLLFGNGSSPFTDATSGSRINWTDHNTSTNGTPNTFSNSHIYITNYRAATAKSVSSESVQENNTTNTIQYINGALWNNTAPITSLALASSSGNLVAGSSVSLYGINRQQAIGKPKAVGGAITFADGHWYHAFTGSGTFTAQEPLTAETLVVAGGGSGGSTEGGGGGAGGFLCFFEYGDI